MLSCPSFIRTCLKISISSLSLTHNLSHSFLRSLPISEFSVFPFCNSLRSNALFSLLINLFKISPDLIRHTEYIVKRLLEKSILSFLYAFTTFCRKEFVFAFINAGSNKLSIVNSSDCFTWNFT